MIIYKKESNTKMEQSGYNLVYFPMNMATFLYRGRDGGKEGNPYQGIDLPKVVVRKQVVCAGSRPTVLSDRYSVVFSSAEYLRVEKINNHY